MMIELRCAAWSRGTPTSVGLLASASAMCLRSQAYWAVSRIQFGTDWPGPRPSACRRSVAHRTINRKRGVSPRSLSVRHSVIVIAYDHPRSSPQPTRTRPGDIGRPPLRFSRDAPHVAHRLPGGAIATGRTGPGVGKTGDFRRPADQTAGSGDQCSDPSCLSSTRRAAFRYLPRG